MKILVDGPISKAVQDYIVSIKQSNIKILKFDRNHGLSYVLNEAIRLCIKEDYEFIVRMDADDISHPQRIEKQIRYLESNKEVEAVGTEAFIINSVNEIIGVKKVTQHLTYPILRKASDMIHPSVTFKMSFFQKVGFYDQNFYRAQDYDLWFRAVRHGIKIDNIKENLYYLRYDERIIDRRKKGQRDVLKIKKKHLSISEYVFLIPHLLIMIVPKFILSKILLRRIGIHKDLG
jgi:glycosyltransferase involved in cell wall biosynthesis